MPITRGAKKALRRSDKKMVFNLKRKRTMKEAVKQIDKLKSEGKTEEISKLMPETYKAIDKAAKRGVITKNTAARKKSRMAKILSKSK